MGVGATGQALTFPRPSIPYSSLIPPPHSVRSHHYSPRDCPKASPQVQPGGFVFLHLVTSSALPAAGGGPHPVLGQASGHIQSEGLGAAVSLRCLQHLPDPASHRQKRGPVSHFGGSGGDFFVYQTLDAVACRGGWWKQSPLCSGLSFFLLRVGSPWGRCRS